MEVGSAGAELIECAVEFGESAGFVTGEGRACWGEVIDEDFEGLVGVRFEWVEVEERLELGEFFEFSIDFADEEGEGEFFWGEEFSEGGFGFIREKGLAWRDVSAGGFDGEGGFDGVADGGDGALECDEAGEFVGWGWMVWGWRGCYWTEGIGIGGMVGRWGLVGCLGLGRGCVAIVGPEGEGEM